MSNEQSSHQRLAAYFAGQHDTWGDLRREAEKRGLSVMELVRMRAEESQSRLRDTEERVQSMLANPMVRRALREGRLPTVDELATSDASALPRRFDAGAFEGAYHRRFGRWPSGAEHDDERGRIERGEPSLLAEDTHASPSAGRTINPPKPRR